MAFDDVKKSLKWAQEGGRVFAYFTAHFVTSWDDTDTPTHDSVRYATGYLQASGDALSGSLETVFANTSKSTLVGGVDEGMELRPDLSYP